MKDIAYKNHATSLSSTNKLVKISVLSVMAFIIMLFEMVVPFFPAFLKMDFSDVPALLGSFALGPVAGVVIQLLKNILHIALKGSITGGVGELGNFLVGSIFVFTAGIIYQIKKDKKHAILGMIAASIAMAIAGALANYYLLIPFYAKIMPIETIINMGTAVNPNIISIKSLVLFGVTPFNLLKGIIISIVVALIYKKITPILHK
jgi:riboflavin transporter